MRTITKISWIFAVIFALSRSEARSYAQELCPKIVASLTPFLGDPSRTEKGQRIEIRQCPLNSEIGTIQIAAWDAGGGAPSLIIDPESRGISQLVMINGAYAFEIVGGSSTGVIGIQYDRGRAKQTVKDGTKGIVKISSDGNVIKIVIDDDDGSGRIRRYELKERE